MKKWCVYLFFFILLIFLISGCVKSEKIYTNYNIEDKKGSDVGDDISRIPSEAIIEDNAYQNTTIIFDVNTMNEVSPYSSFTSDSIFSTQENGVFASMVSPITGEEISLSDLNFDIFMDQNFSYIARIEWKTNAIPDISGVGIITTKYDRLTGEEIIMPMDYLSYPGNSTSVHIESSSFIIIDEDKEYIFKIQSCFSSSGVGCIQYNLTVITPRILPANVHCNKILDNGANKLNLIFVPFNYSVDDLSKGRLENDVTKVLFSRQVASDNVASRRAFFDIPILNESYDEFNIVVVHDQVPCCYNNQLLSIGRACGFDKTDDMFVIMSNEESGTAYAQNIGVGIWVWLPKGRNWEGAGSTLAHEMAHLIGMDEEYYMLDSGTAFARNAPNCDYGNLTCERWCDGTDQELVEQIYDAKENYDRCKTIINSGNIARWNNFCPTLDLSQYLNSNNEFYGVGSLEEFCELPLSDVQGYACYAGTFASLEKKNIGVGCQSGYGCYFGCGTQYYYTKSSITSIMGGGALGENWRLYDEIDNYSNPIMPDYSKSTHETIERYFSKFI